jgi:large subunit ribosomal protein L3
VISGILGKKLGMTQIFKKGDCIPVTVLQVGPCPILQVKTPEKDGYFALQLGYDDKREKSATKAELGHVKKHAHTGPKKFVKEVEWDGKDTVEPGHNVTVEILQKLRYVDVTGISKGKGFQGGVKRYGFKGGPKTHGQSDRQRAPGSIGSNTDPARVVKGMRMAGHTGNAQSTARNLEVVEIDEKQNLILVKGGVPGYTGGYVVVKRT